MPRDRWTLALIILCLPILATVITAFRVRDLPKVQDTSKLTKKCEDCNVKAGHKVHGEQTESDKHRNEELKIVIREKQPLANQKLESKSNHRYDVRSEEDEDDDDVGISKIKTGFRQEIPKVNKLEKSGSESKTLNVNLKDVGDSDKKLKNKPILVVSKTPVLTKNHDTSSTNSKVTELEPKRKVVEKDDDDDDDEDDDDDDGDGDGDDDDDDDNESYDGLDNIDELFKILHMDKKPKQESKTIKNIAKTEQKTLKPITIKIDLNDNEDDDDDDEDDDDLFAEIVKDKKTPHMPTITKKEQLKKPILEETKNKVLNNKPKEKDEPMQHNPKPVTKHEKEGVKKGEKAKPMQAPVKNRIEAKILEGTKPNTLSKSIKDEKNLSDNDKPISVAKMDETKSKDKVKPKPQPGIPGTKEPDKESSKSKFEQVIKASSTPKKSQDEKTIDKSDKKFEEKKTAKERSEEKIEDKIPAYDLKKKNHDKNDHETRKKASSWMESFEERLEEKKSATPLLSKNRDEQNAENVYDSGETTSHLKHVTEALHRRNLLKSEFEDFYSFFPTFAPNFSRIHNAECRRHGQIVLRQLRGTKLWALNMLDATAKIPSGVLQGNGIQLGDFDQCIGSRARVKLDGGSVVKVQGKYCLARIDVKAEHTELEAPVYLAQAKSLIRSKIDDPGHFVPRFSTLSWGVCVPSACNPGDVEIVLKDAVKHYQHTSGVLLRVKVDEEDCYTDDGDVWEDWLEMPTILTMSFYGVIVLLVLVATIQEFLTRKTTEDEQGEAVYKEESEQKEENSGEQSTPKRSDGFIHSFSLYYTISKLAAPGTADEIACIHGIRGIATLALLVAHKFLPVAVMPYTNRVKIAELVSSPIWSWCRAGWIFTDCFLLLSGALTAHRIAGDGDSNALRRLFSRYMRLTPALLAVVLFYAYVWDKLSVGPMWGTFVTKNAEVCQEGWWWNIIYIQNYFGFEDMCAPQTHQLALDMQLTILGGVIVWVAQSAQGMAKLILPGIHLGAAYLRYSTVRDHRLTLLAYHGVRYTPLFRVDPLSVSQLYRTARLSYMSTIHRCSPYLIGISLGMALRKPSQHGKIVLFLGWLTCGVLWALVLWAGYDSGYAEYRYSATFAAQYATFAPIASALALAWVIYAVHSGTCEFLSQFLCWRPLVFISRLSYAMYLSQFIIFITNIGTVKTAKEFTLASLIDVQEISAIILSSTILTLTFVIPMQSLHKVFSFSFALKDDNNASEEIFEETADSDSKRSPESESEPIIEESTEVDIPIRRPNFLAHREVLAEIPEAEVEYESQREKSDGLDEILEEEEGTIGDEEENLDDLEIIEEEEAGEDEAWADQGERSYSRNADQDIDEWEWTSNGQNGAQYYRYAR